MHSKVNAGDIFSSLFFFWRTTCNQYLIALYDAFVTTIATFAFPVHLLLGAAFAERNENIFINLAIGISAIACTLKHFLLRPQLTEILFVNDILQQLDERVENVEDIRYYVTHIRRRSIFMMRFFTMVYFSVGIMAVLSALWSGKILYPAYVIIDWHSSTGKYLLVMLFQVYGLTMQIIQSVTNDAYGPMVLCLLSGHVHLLARRIARIGHDIDGDTVEDTYRALVLCIGDYKLLMSTTKQVERIISSTYVVQFSAVGINVVWGLIYLLFFADNLLAYGYYIFHILAIMIEIFPCCFYGRLVQAEFHALSYAIFRCNWLTQPLEFRRNLMTFVELSLYEVTVLAGGVMRIHLDSFFKTCKMAYSLFTVIQSMK
ncbi:odorant receptor 33b-like [Rhagoletis pomonella]|uniref:odorant receptor 33b-like n=1 Tax=Rhagoletis pomonella TaxID=28610 RepID=UPI00177BCC8C|nr:odorant receptor 33b-like [Rhagoletis pomonella]